MVSSPTSPASGAYVKLPKGSTIRSPSFVTIPITHPGNTLSSSALPTRSAISLSIRVRLLNFFGKIRIPHGASCGHDEVGDGVAVFLKISGNGDTAASDDGVFPTQFLAQCCEPSGHTK